MGRFRFERYLLPLIRFQRASRLASLPLKSLVKNRLAGIEILLNLEFANIASSPANNRRENNAKPSIFSGIPWTAAENMASRNYSGDVKNDWETSVTNGTARPLGFEHQIGVEPSRTFP